MRDAPSVRCAVRLAAPGDEVITEFDQWKTPAGHWIVIIKSDRDFQPMFNPGPHIWYETDGTGEKGLAHQIKASMR